MNNLNSIVDYLKVFNNINKRKPYEPRTMANGGLMEEYHGKDKLDWMENFKDQMTFEEYLRWKRSGSFAHGGSAGQLVQNTADGSRPGYSGKMKWTTKEVQAIYKDLPEGMNVSKRVLPSGRTDYTYRAKILGKNIGKKDWIPPSMVATPENKKKMAKLVEAKYDEWYPNRLSREEYAKLRLKPENRRLSGEDFAKKLNDADYTTYTGEKWRRGNVYNYDLEAPRSKTRLAKDLGFFEKRTVAEAKELIKTFSGGKDFLKNKNLTDADITTKAASYIAQEKHLDKSGGTHWPHGRQNKRKVWKNIYESHKQKGRFKLVNGDELAGKDGKINWKKDQNWKWAKFEDTNSGRIYTYDNLQKMVEKHDGGWNKAIKAYDDNAKLHQTTFKGKSLNDWFREGMIKKEYEAKLSKGGKKVKVTWNDKDFKNYLGRRKKGYGFAEAHHYKGVKDYPFEAESSFRYANRRQGNIQNSYNKAIKSGNPDRIAKAKIKYAEDMTNLSDEMGGIRFKMDDTRFVGAKGTEEGIIRTGAKVSGMSDANQIKLFKQLGYRCRKAGGAGESVACYMSDVEQTRADMKSSDVTVRAKALTKQRKSLQLASKIPQLKKILKTGVQFGTAAITKPLEWLGFTTGLGYAIEGIVEGGFYDNARRKGFSHEQAMAETFTPGLLAGRPEDVPWYGGSEKLREKELYEVKGRNEFIDVENRPPMQDPEFEKVIGTKGKVKQYVDALEEQDRIYSAIGKKERLKGQEIYDPTGVVAQEQLKAAADVQDLARSGAYGRVDRTMDPESMASQAYNTAVEKRDALDQRRRTEYLEKYDPQALEHEQKSFDIYARDKEGEILYEKPQSMYKKRYKEMDEMYPDYSKEDIDHILLNMYGTSMEKLEGKGYTYENIGKWFKDKDKSSYFADNFRTEKAEGGIMNLKKKW